MSLTTLDPRTAAPPHMGLVTLAQPRAGRDTGHILAYANGLAARGMAVLLASFVLCMIGSIAWSQALPVAGGEDGLCVLMPGDNNSLKIFYRRFYDTPDELRVMRVLQGTHVAPGGVVATPKQLWIVFKSTPSQPRPAVVTVPVTTPSPQRIGDPPSEPKPSLPLGTTLKALAVTRDSPWALLRVERPETLKEIDEPSSSQAAGPTPTSPVDVQRFDHSPAIDSASPPQVDGPNVPQTDSSAGSIDVPGETHAAVSESARAFDVGLPIVADRLVRLEHGRWVKVDLPHDWPDHAACWLITRTETDAHPLLVVLPALSRGNGDHDVWVYEYNDTAWQRQVYRLGVSTSDSPDNTQSIGDSHPGDSLNGSNDLATPGDGPSHDPSWSIDQPGAAPVVLAVDSQLVMGFIRRVDNELDADFCVLRSGKAIPLGRLSLGCPDSGRWAVTRYGSTVVAIVHDPDHWLSWAGIDLQGRGTTPPTELTTPAISPFAQVADSLIFISVLIVATLIMFVVWRRDQSENRLDLPDGVELADLGRRGAAALIDLLPCFVATMVYFDVDVLYLINHWPGRSGGWSEMLPGAVLIGLFVLHTTLAELLTARSLGKWLVGVRVATMRGQRPALWQILLRGLMKIFDLVAWLLLFLVIAGPYRQRLGDLVARTVVVMTPQDLDGEDDGQEQ